MKIENIQKFRELDAELDLIGLWSINPIAKISVYKSSGGLYTLSELKKQFDNTRIDFPA